MYFICSPLLKNILKYMYVIEAKFLSYGYPDNTMIYICTQVLRNCMVLGLEVTIFNLVYYVKKKTSILKHCKSEDIHKDAF